METGGFGGGAAETLDGDQDQSWKLCAKSKVLKLCIANRASSTALPVSGSASTMCWPKKGIPLSRPSDLDYPQVDEESLAGLYKHEPKNLKRAPQSTNELVFCNLHTGEKKVDLQPSQTTAFHPPAARHICHDSGSCRGFSAAGSVTRMPKRCSTKPPRQLHFDPKAM